MRRRRWLWSGGLFIFSATGEASQAQALYKQMFFLQIIWFAVGLGAAAAVCLVDYGKLARWSRVVYWGAMVSLAAVLVFGKVIHGGRRWISLGDFRICNPRNLPKLRLSSCWPISSAGRRRNCASRGCSWRRWDIPLLPFVLILREPDLGSALVFLSISLAMMFVAGVPNRILAGLVGGVGLLVVLLVAVILFAPPNSDIVNPTRKSARCLTPILDLGEKSYNVKQALISVGSGGMVWKRLAAGDAA